MAGLTRDFKETVVRRAERDAEFRREMLKTGIELLLTGDSEDAEIGREKLRTYINATVGFERLASQLGKSPKSLMRMFSAAGNPSLSNLSAVIGKLQRLEGVRLRIKEAS
jgi:DNA-binding phage protein